MTWKQKMLLVLGILVLISFPFIWGWAVRYHNASLTIEARTMVRKLYDAESQQYDKFVDDMPDLPETNPVVEIPPFPDAPFDRAVLAFSEASLALGVKGETPTRCRFRAFRANDSEFRNGRLFLVRGVCPCGTGRYTLIERVAGIDSRLYVAQGGSGVYVENCQRGDPKEQLDREWN